MISDERTQSASRTTHPSPRALVYLIPLTHCHDELRLANHRLCGPGIARRERIEWIMVEGSKARGRRLARLPKMPTVISLTSAVSGFNTRSLRILKHIVSYEGFSCLDVFWSTNKYIYDLLRDSM